MAKPIANPSPRNGKWAANITGLTSTRQNHWLRTYTGSKVKYSGHSLGAKTNTGQNQEYYW